MMANCHCRAGPGKDSRFHKMAISLKRSVAYPVCMRNCLLVAVLPFALLALCAAARDSGSSGWQQVQGLGPHTRIHIKSDKENAICFVHSVDEQQLSCGRSEAIGSPVLVFPREQIKSIKLSLRVPGAATRVGYVSDLFDGQLVYQR
jgi:hypothetical protein